MVVFDWCAGHPSQKFGHVVRAGIFSPDDAPQGIVVHADFVGQKPDGNLADSNVVAQKLG